MVTSRSFQTSAQAIVVGPLFPYVIKATMHPGLYLIVLEATLSHSDGGNNSQASSRLVYYICDITRRWWPQPLPWTVENQNDVD